MLGSVMERRERAVVSWAEKAEIWGEREEKSKPQAMNPKCRES